MNQNIKKFKDPHAGQFQYLDRWVDKNTFRAFVYDKDSEQKLANSYKEFEELLATGLWFAKKPETRKKKDVVCPAS